MYEKSVASSEIECLSIVDSTKKKKKKEYNKCDVLGFSGLLSTGILLDVVILFYKMSETSSEYTLRRSLHST